MSSLPEDSLPAALRWVTEGGYYGRFDGPRWETLISDLKSRGERPWSYVMFMVYYDSVFREAGAARLRKGPYVTSDKTLSRFREWLKTHGQFVEEAVHRQLKYLRNQIRLGMEPEYILQFKYVDASIMTRLEVAVECREELGDSFDDIVDKFFDRAVEMVMGLPWYETLTPKACKLIREWRHE